MLYFIISFLQIIIRDLKLKKSNFMGLETMCTEEIQVQQPTVISEHKE